MTLPFHNGLLSMQLTNPFTGQKIRVREIAKRMHQRYARSEIKLIIFDLDDTLIDREGIPFDQAENILQWAKNGGYMVALASYNPSAEKIISMLGWEEYFDYIAPFGMTETKKIHLTDVLMTLNVRPQNSVFVDDLMINVEHARELGIHALKVNPKHGARLNAVINIIMG